MTTTRKRPGEAATTAVASVQRAIPRDALTGAPIRSDTVHIHVHDPLATRDNGPHTHRSRKDKRAAVYLETLPTLHLPDHDASNDLDGGDDGDDDDE